MSEKGSDEYKSFEDDPSMKWVGDLLPPSICHSCLNRLCDFQCGELSEQEQSLVLRTGECSEYIKIHVGVTKLDIGVTELDDL